MDRARVIALMEKRRWDNRQLAAALGISEDKVSKTLSETAAKPRRWQGDEVARLIELEAEGETPIVKSEVRGTGMTAEEVRSARATANSKALPLYGSAWGGEWEEGVDFAELRLDDALDYVARPANLANDLDAYAVEIVGESMAPRYEPRERAAVSPRASVTIGDDVIVQVRRPGENGDVADAVTHVLIKRLMRWGGDFIELRQFNPEKTFRVPLRQIAVDPRGKPAIHKVTNRI